jgi:hypothetical protein
MEVIHQVLEPILDFWTMPVSSGLTIRPSAFQTLVSTQADIVAVSSSIT